MCVFTIYLLNSNTWYICNTRCPGLSCMHKLRTAVLYFPPTVWLQGCCWQNLRIRKQEEYTFSEQKAAVQAGQKVSSAEIHLLLSYFGFLSAQPLLSWWHCHAVPHWYQTTAASWGLSAQSGLNCKMWHQVGCDARNRCRKSVKWLFSQYFQWFGLSLGVSEADLFWCL